MHVAAGGARIRRLIERELSDELLDAADVNTPSCAVDSPGVTLCPPPRRIRCSSPRLPRPRNDGIVNV